MFHALRPLVFALDPERAHGLTLAALRSGLVPRAPADDPILATRVAGLALPNPVGLAAGFDKDVLVPDAMLRLGFGFVECGSVTPRPQDGNPRPRLFRLVDDAAVINRMGFNNLGLDHAVTRLTARRGRPGIVGINLGANKDSNDRTADYVAGVRAAGALASYVTVNISSPNTPGLRALQDGAALTDLVARVVAARGSLPVPLFVKVAPDLEPADFDTIARIALDGGVDGLIVSNTTISRPPLRSRDAGEAGGLSGAPLAPLALAALQGFARATGGALPLIAAGGIASGADAYARIRAGASAVQLYSALVYEGPGLVQRIKADLAGLLRRDGFASVGDAVGA
ncbi:quinone-dependent dihydroorotate dehydrogenase [Polymorphobacter fuscus]|uniref:Dihydroorotate dehydrogenase (quinone) n=1 Tax=Sandarakinorhabdus fusca TaxID=1439888 RepID=A0A7C9GQD2_9SPHN|nr:quinone-dependent dihydroorotate dehydrogenase [Polymorphobacter fuscus]KAB7644928.1 quinone-dependent dihydroorotate dehydrogenase [Polymorphobacter fuscus]MQT18215.1 quinone-dependent dihydroorotate dehydrogenase [Polymorphobacter fuscus]NJC09537.1 dihydroorotate dehydrogenase [Polymorphobacter fuscus]